jgi:hypothetical protein
MQTGCALALTDRFCRGKGELRAVSFSTHARNCDFTRALVDWHFQIVHTVAIDSWFGRAHDISQRAYTAEQAASGQTGMDLRADFCGGDLCGLLDVAVNAFRLDEEVKRRADRGTISTYLFFCGV